MKRNAFLRVSGFVLLFLLSVALLFNCEKDKDTATGGGEQTIKTVVTNLAASPDSVVVGGSSIISAIVTTSGQIDSGVVVNFSCSPSYVGSVSVDVDTSDVNGQVATIFYSNNIGIAYVYASTSDTTASIPVYVISSEPSTGEGGLSIQVNPTVIPANGDTTAEVTVTVRDVNGNPVADGTVVRLAAGEKFDDVDGDGYYNEYIDVLVYDTNNDGIWNPIGDIPITATTSSGVATATYTAGYRAGMVYIKATAGPPDNVVQDDATVLLIPTAGDTVASIALEPSSPTIQVRGTGGIEFVEMTATCYDDNGNRVMEGWPVIFSILNGPNGGENINGSTSPCTVSTNSSGIAQVTVNSGTISGTINLIATSGAVISNSTRITVCAGPPKHISIGVDPLNIRGFDVVGAEAEVGAVVVDSFSNYVPNGTAVYFYTSEGMITPEDWTSTGRAQATYVSARTEGDNGRVWIYAETAGGTVRDSCHLYVTAQPSYTFITVWPGNIAADQEAKSKILVEVYDLNMNPVIAGFKVELCTIYGTASPDEGETEGSGTMTNLFESEYVSTTLDEDYSYTIPDDGVGAIDVLSAAAVTGIGDSKSITMTTDVSYYENCSISSMGTVYYGKPGVLFVKINDKNGTPLGGHQIDITTIEGATLTSPLSAYTDKFGNAPFTFIATSDLLIENIIVGAYDSVDPLGLGSDVPMYQSIPIEEL